MQNSPKQKLRNVLSTLFITTSQTGSLALLVLFLLIKKHKFKPIILYFIFYILNLKTHYTCYRDTFPWKFFNLRNSSVFKWFSQYFSSKIIYEDESAFIDKSTTPFLFCLHPHGVFSFTSPIGFGTNALPDHPISKIEPSVAVANLPFYIPIAREIGYGVKCISANKSTVINHLRKGHSVVLVPGGASEALHVGGSELKLVLSNRLGFIKIVLETKCKLVPAIGFGEKETFKRVEVKYQQSLYQKIQYFIMKLTGISLPLFTAKYSLLLPWLPRNDEKITIVVGRPIDYDEDMSVEDLHAKYILEIKKLHSKYAPKYGGLREQKLNIITNNSRL